VNRHVEDFLRSAVRRVKVRPGVLAGLVRHRRAQLLIAVLFGAVIGGGFVAVTSSGVGADEHSDRPGVSVMDQSDPYRMDNSGYDG
jgi:hypothetical protein